MFIHQFMITFVKVGLFQATQYLYNLTKSIQSIIEKFFNFSSKVSVSSLVSYIVQIDEHKTYKILILIKTMS
jgi:hypothetical protein